METKTQDTVQKHSVKRSDTPTNPDTQPPNSSKMWNSFFVSRGADVPLFAQYETRRLAGAPTVEGLARINLEIFLAVLP